ncbi:MAG: hypothetical protein V3R99_04965 [Thermoguttaceae bacterium]
MMQQAVDIDRIVREVLARLGHAPGANGTEAAAVGHDLVLSCSVVTLSALEGRLSGVQRVVVPPQAVVTPSVRDELYRRNVALAHEGSKLDEPSAVARLVLVTAGKRYDPAALVEALRSEAIDVEPHASDCLIESTDLLADKMLHSSSLGLLLTRHPAAALCLANRHSGVRAVSGTDAATIADATVSVGANLLVIDPTAVGALPLKRIVTDFCRGEEHTCPAVFQERLG